MDVTGQAPGSGANVFDEAMRVITGAQASGIPVRLVGGLAVRFLTPDFPPRARDAQDVIYLLSAMPVDDGDGSGTVGLGWFTKIVGEDWGWWRTATLNLDKIITLASGEAAHLVPANAPFDAVAQARRLRAAADEA